MDRFITIFYKSTFNFLGISTVAFLILGCNPLEKKYDTYELSSVLVSALEENHIDSLQYLTMTRGMSIISLPSDQTITLNDLLDKTLTACSVEAKKNQVIIDSLRDAKRLNEIFPFVENLIYFGFNDIRYIIKAIQCYGSADSFSTASLILHEAYRNKVISDSIEQLYSSMIILNKTPENCIQIGKGDISELNLQNSEDGKTLVEQLLADHKTWSNKAFQKGFIQNNCQLDIDVLVTIQFTIEKSITSSIWFFSTTSREQYIRKRSVKITHLSPNEVRSFEVSLSLKQHSDASGDLALSSNESIKNVLVSYKVIKPIFQI